MACGGSRPIRSTNHRTPLKLWTVNFSSSRRMSSRLWAFLRRTGSRSYCATGPRPNRGLHKAARFSLRDQGALLGYWHDPDVFFAAHFPFEPDQWKHRTTRRRTPTQRKRGLRENLGDMLAQLQLPAGDLGGDQLVAGRQFNQRLSLGERGQRHLSFELGRIS